LFLIYSEFITKQIVIPACEISYNEVFVCSHAAGSKQLYVNYKLEAKCTLLIVRALAAVLCTILTQNLRLICSFFEAEIVLNLFLNFEQK